MVIFRACRLCYKYDLKHLFFQTLCAHYKIRFQNLLCVFKSLLYYRIIILNKTSPAL